MIKYQNWYILNMSVKYKDYRIYKISTAYPIKKTDKGLEIFWKRCDEKIQLTQQFIEKYSGETFKSLLRFTAFANLISEKQVPYSKPWLTNTLEIGKDMIMEKTGVLFQHHWRSEYWMVPKNRTDIIEWMDSNVPSWVSIVKRV